MILTERGTQTQFYFFWKPLRIINHSLIWRDKKIEFFLPVTKCRKKPWSVDFDFTSDVTSWSFIDSKGGFTERNNACRARIQILIPSFLANPKILRMLKLINGILEEWLERKLVIETLSGEMWSCNVLSLVRAIQRKKGTVLLKMKTLIRREETTRCTGLPSLP